MGYAADAGDSQLARLRGSSSLSGQWLDHVVDAIMSSALHAALLISWFRFFDLEAISLLIPLAYRVIRAVFFLGMILTDQLRRMRQSTTALIVEKSGSVSDQYALAVVPADNGLRCLTFLFFAWQPAFVVAYVLFFWQTSSWLRAASGVGSARWIVSAGECRLISMGCRTERIPDGRESACTRRQADAFHWFGDGG